jgi:nitroreductase
LIGAAQSAATSSNLNLWSVVSVQDPTRRKALAELCGNQEHIVKAPWFLVFVADHYRLKQAVRKIGESGAGLDYAEFALMAVIDAALAAEHLVCAAESLGIGICYIGATRNNPDKLQELLSLPEGTFAVFGLCLGYPSEGNRAQIKPRPSQETLWFKEVYDQDVSCEEYDRRMEPFYIEQGMKGSVTWSMRSGRRVDGQHMTGREVLKDYLERQGFYRR